MRVAVHPIKANIWRAMEEGKLRTGMSLREIGKIIGERSPQKVKHHLDAMRIMGTVHWKNGMYELEFGDDNGTG